ncbi:hypothetical protein KUCAC02_026354, partial [Chaenocephalus aceratus]
MQDMTVSLRGKTVNKTPRDQSLPCLYHSVLCNDIECCDTNTHQGLLSADERKAEQIRLPRIAEPDSFLSLPLLYGNVPVCGEVRQGLELLRIEGAQAVMLHNVDGHSSWSQGWALNTDSSPPEAFSSDLLTHSHSRTFSPGGRNPGRANHREAERREMTAYPLQ